MPRHKKKRFGGLTITDAELMAAALVGFEHQRDEIEEKMAELRRQLDGRAGRPARSAAGVNTEAPPVRKKRTMSAAGRRRVAAAQRKRWAELKKAQAEDAAPVKTKKRKLSAEAKRRMAEGAKKRWAEFRKRKGARK